MISWLRALEAGKAVVLEFTANWCVNCKVLEKQVLHTGPVAKALNGENVLSLKVDLSKKSFKAGWDKLKALGATGPPLLVIYEVGR